MDRFLGLKLPFYGIINSFFIFIFYRYVLREGVRRASRKRTGDARPRRFQCDLCSNRTIQYGFICNPISLCCESRFVFFFFRFIMERPDASRTSFNIWWVSSRPSCWAARCTHIVLCEHSSFSWYEQGGGSCFVLLSLSYRQPKRRVGFYLPIAKIVFVVVRVRSFLYFFLCLYYRWKWWKSLG